MPTLAFTARELHDAEFLAAAAAALSDDEESDDEFIDELLFASCDPMVKELKQEIGVQHLSVQRLKLEAAGRGLSGDLASRNVYCSYGFRLEDLPAVVEALQPPPAFRVRGGAVFSGEEGVLLLLRRFRSTGPLLDLTKDAGRPIAHISEAVTFMVEHVHSRFAHLIDVRSFEAWAPRFESFAQVFKNKGAPIDNLIGFIDGKLQSVCKPGKYQHVLYSGHKRVHGLKTQGIVFPNGIQPFPFGPVLGSRHDSFLLRVSGVLHALRLACMRLGADYVLFGDSAYPISRFLWRMYKGVQSPAQKAFNAQMAPLRIAAEWGFGKIVTLWPFLDYRKKHMILLSPVGLYFPVGNVLTNMHTCLYGSNISNAFDMEPPSLSAYMAGGPF